MPPGKMKLRYLRLVRKVRRLLENPRLQKYTWWRGIQKAFGDRRYWHPTRETVAAGFSIGVFFSMMFMPFQTVAATIVAVKARANIPVAVAACFITNPLTMPFIWTLQKRLGRWLRQTFSLELPRLEEIGKGFTATAADFILGFLTMGILAALLAYPLVYLLAALLPKQFPSATDINMKNK